jgi:hypothetical protein
VRGDKNPKSSGTLVPHIAFDYSAESNQASDGYSSLPGKNGWFYQSWNGTVYASLDFAPLTNRFLKSGSAITIGPKFMRPDAGKDAVRKWVAPHAGKIRIEGLVQQMATGGSNQTEVKILHNLTSAWGPNTVTSITSASHDFNLDVAQGDSISFQCHVSAAYTGSDSVNWDPVITYLSGGNSNISGTALSLTGASSLLGAMPNPFAGVTKIKFQVPSAQEMTIQLFDIHGRLIKTLVEGTISAGYHQVAFNNRDANGRLLVNGVYFCRMQAKGFEKTMKLLLVK